MAKHRAWIAGDYAIVSTYAGQHVVRIIETQPDGKVKGIRQYPRQHQLERFEDMRDERSGNIVPPMILNPTALIERVEQY